MNYGYTRSEPWVGTFPREEPRCWLWRCQADMVRSMVRSWMGADLLQTDLAFQSSNTTPGPSDYLVLKVNTEVYIEEPFSSSDPDIRECSLSTILPCILKHDPASPTAVGHPNSGEGLKGRSRDLAICPGKFSFHIL